MSGGKLTISTLDGCQKLEQVSSALRVLRPRIGYVALYRECTRTQTANPRDTVFPINEKPSAFAVRPDLKYAAYTTENSCAYVDNNGHEVWRCNFPVSTAKKKASPNKASCDFSRDGTVLWLYQPGHNTRAGDTLIAIDAENGQNLSHQKLSSKGHCAQFFMHPTSQYCLLSIIGRKGQAWNYLFNFSQSFWLLLTEFEWAKERIPLDVSPSSFHFATLGNEHRTSLFTTFERESCWSISPSRP